ncbi:MAG: hypothetical protein AAF389_05575 [Gemmatimonadota bacterium]
MRWLRSVAAVVGGLLAGMVVVIGLTAAATFLLFEGDMSAPPTPGYLAANVLYSAGAAGLAGWIAARWAPSHGLVHSGAVALIMLLMSSGGTSAAEGVPSWYGPAVAVLAPVGALVGGWLRVRSVGRSANE